MTYVPAPPVIVLYDGVCGLCDRWVQFVLKRDSADQFRFAALQSLAAEEILRRHGVSVSALNTLYAVLDAGRPTERVLERSAAVLSILQRIGGVWRAVAVFGTVTPRRFLDWGYDLVAEHRYRVFGRYDQCRLPTARDRAKFLVGDEHH